MENGQSFPDFALGCARAFGALVMMRDDPIDAPIPEFKPSDFYISKLAAAKAEIAQLKAMDDAGKIAYGHKQKAEAIKSRVEWLERERVQNERLKEMRARVAVWGPPSDDHVGLKTFMLEQIDRSTNDTKYILELLDAERNKNPLDYYASAVDSAKQSLSYMSDEDRKERERTEGRNLWVNQLKNSLR